MLCALAALALAPQTFREIKPDLVPQTAILTFHDLIERRDNKALWFDCTTQEFEHILDWLQAHKASFVSLDRLYRHLTTGESLPPNPVVITFADNYLGFYTRALPILKKRHIPAAMFVHTGYVGSPVGRPKMNWPQLQALDREGLITVASQTVSHPADLRTLTAIQLDREMRNSKASLEAHLGHAVEYLAYPNGKWNGQSVSAAYRAGYLMAFTEDLAPAETATSIFAVPRYVHTKYRRAWSDAHRD